MLPNPFILSLQQRSIRSTTHDVTPFLHNLIYQYTNPLSFETEAHSIHTIPLLREHLDAYLYNFRYKTLEITPSQQPFQIIFNPVQGINNGTFYRTIHPQNLTLSIQDIFLSYINKLIEHNENLDTPLYRPSLLDSLKEKADYFDVPDLDTKVIRHNNPHYWLQQDLLQVTNFQYRFFRNISLDDDTIPQIKVFSLFLLKFFRFNYQLLWEQKDQNAYIHFPQVLTKTEFLSFLIRNDFKHPYYKDFTTIHTSHIDFIELNPDFLLEQSETSDNRPYTNLFQNNTNEDENILSETSDTGPYINLTQDNTTENENVIQHQPTTPRHPSQITHDSTESVPDTLTNPPKLLVQLQTLMLFKYLPETSQNIIPIFSPRKTLLHYLSQTQVKHKHLQYTIQYNQIMIHPLLHLIILLIVLLIIHLDKDLPIHFPLDNHL